LRRRLYTKINQPANATCGGSVREHVRRQQRTRTEAAVSAPACSNVITMCGGQDARERPASAPGTHASRTHHFPEWLPRPPPMGPVVRLRVRRTECPGDLAHPPTRAARRTVMLNSDHRLRGTPVGRLGNDLANSGTPVEPSPGPRALQQTTCSHRGIPGSNTALDVVGGVRPRDCRPSSSAPAHEPRSRSLSEDGCTAGLPQDRATHRLYPNRRRRRGCGAMVGDPATRQRPGDQLDRRVCPCAPGEAGEWVSSPRPEGMENPGTTNRLVST